VFIEFTNFINFTRLTRDFNNIDPTLRVSVCLQFRWLMKSPSSFQSIALLLHVNLTWRNQPASPLARLAACVCVLQDRRRWYASSDLFLISMPRINLLSCIRAFLLLSLTIWQATTEGNPSVAFSSSYDQLVFLYDSEILLAW